MHMQNEARRLKALNVRRQKDLISETEKLVKLADELNAHVDSGLGGKPSGADLKEAEMIGKLARNVRDLMRQTYDPQQEVKPWR
jgi:hypothetical protein